MKNKRGFHGFHWFFENKIKTDLSFFFLTDLSKELSTVNIVSVPLHDFSTYRNWLSILKKLLQRNVIQNRGSNVKICKIHVRDFFFTNFEMINRSMLSSSSE